LSQTYQITDEQLIKEVQQLTIDYHADNILSFVKDGAMITGNYVLNYTNELSSDIKLKYRRAALELQTKLLNNLKQRVEHEQEQLRKESIKYEKIAEKLKENENLTDQLTDYLQQLNELMENNKQDDEALMLIKQSLNSRNQF